MKAVSTAHGLLTVLSVSLAVRWTAVVAAETATVVAVDVSPVVHAGSPFTAVLTLPPPLARKKGVEAEAWSLDEAGEVTTLVKRRLAVSTGGGKVSLQHELEGLVIGYVLSVC